MSLALVHSEGTVPLDAAGQVLSVRKRPPPPFNPDAPIFGLTASTYENWLESKSTGPALTAETLQRAMFFCLNGAYARAVRTP